MYTQLLIGQPWSTERQVVSRYCEEAKKLGATAMVVNRLPDDFHPGVIEDPENQYSRFFSWGPSLDMFFATELNKDVWPEELLVRNRKALLCVCDVARSYGLKLVYLLGEPRYQPERFFDKNPHLRGPRVDNPNTSRTPYFAPCISTPELRKHYRQMMSQLMHAIPDLDGIIFYNGDSGTGICHSERLYAGPNGSRFCEKIPPKQKMLDFVRLLTGTAQETNPELKLWMFHYIKGEEREHTLKNTDARVSFIATGNYATGTFEDPFAAWKYREKIDEVGYEFAFKERIEMMENDVRRLETMGKSVLRECTLPVEQWVHPLRTVPYPYQVFQILKELDDIDADNIFFYGGFSDPEIVPYEVNRDIIGRYRERPSLSPDELIRNLAEEWTTPGCADDLAEAWRLCDRAYRRRPLFAWSFAGGRSFFPGPLVPDVHGLSTHEKSYYYTAAMANKDRIPGSDFRRVLRHDEQYRNWMIDRFRKEAISPAQKALLVLDRALENTDDGKARTCLSTQYRQIAAFKFCLTLQANWLDSGRYLAPGTGTANFERTMVQIIDDEIERTSELGSVIDGHVEELYTSHKNTIYAFNESLMDALRLRIELMKAHRNDAIRPYELPEQL